MKITIEHKGKIITILPDDEQEFEFLEGALLDIIEDAAVSVEDSANPAFYSVRVERARPEKIQAIKQLRGMLGLPLKEAKEVVDGMRHLRLGIGRALDIDREVKPFGFGLYNVSNNQPVTP